jgi:hypothetical protein
MPTLTAENRVVLGDCLTKLQHLDERLTALKLKAVDPMGHVTLDTNEAAEIVRIHHEQRWIRQQIHRVAA